MADEAAKADPPPPGAASIGGLAIAPPVEPMLAKLAEAIPDADADAFLFEPKWDGFRALVFRGDTDVFIQSRDLRPLDRYFPELHELLIATLPAGCVVDGEIVIAGPHGLDFDRLQLRLHPAASRVAKLAAETPSAFVAFDLLAVDGQDIRELPQQERRVRLEQLLAEARPPLHLTPMTRDRALAVEWLERFEGAGLDGVMAKPIDAPYQPGKRKGFVKIKHVRTIDVVVMGWRPGKEEGTVGSLILGLHDDDGKLRVVGHTSGFKAAEKRELPAKLAPYETGNRGTGDPSRWDNARDLEWIDLRPELVVEITFDHTSNDRIRHGTKIVRWREDKKPGECSMEQLKS